MKQTPAKLLSGRQKFLRGNVYDVHCPSRGVLEHVTSRWGSLVLLVLLGGTQRFSELVRGIGGVSEKMLAQSLKALEADGLVARKVYPTVPPKVEYSLTKMGSEVAVHLRTLTDWVEDRIPEVMEHRSRAEKKSAQVSSA